MSIGEVSLTGRLICADDEQIAIVVEHLPRHTELTRAESGCLEFSVVQTDDPRVWQVDERFTATAAFEAHQRRVSVSEWGRATKHIERDYILRIAD